MFEELQLALSGAVSPERLEVFLEALRLLNELGVTTVDDELQQVLGLQDGISDTYLFVSRVEDTLTYGLEGALRQYEIECKPETPLYIQVALLSTVGSLEHYIIPEILLDLTLTDQEPEVILSQLVPLFTEHDSESVLEYLQSVKATTIRRIHELARDRLAYRVPEDEQPSDLRERVIKLNGLRRQLRFEGPQLVMQLVDRGVRCGRVALEQVLTEVADELAELDPQQLPAELVGLVLFSKTELDQVLPHTIDLVHDYTDRLSLRAHLEQAVISLHNSL